MRILSERKFEMELDRVREEERSRANMWRDMDNLYRRISELERLLGEHRGEGKTCEPARVL